MRTITKIIIHCAAIPLVPDGARCTPYYHAVIHDSGIIEIALPLEQVTALQHPHRETSLDLCLIKGNLGISEAQQHALRGFVSQLTHQFPTAAIEDSHGQPL